MAATRGPLARAWQDAPRATVTLPIRRADAEIGTSTSPSPSSSSSMRAGVNCQPQGASSSCCRSAPMERSDQHAGH